MIRPDLALICENMLMSEGFRAARPLSIKFVTLYQLSSELLSPQVRYSILYIYAISVKHVLVSKSIACHYYIRLQPHSIYVYAPCSSLPHRQPL